MSWPVRDSTAAATAAPCSTWWPRRRGPVGDRGAPRDQRVQEGHHEPERPGWLAMCARGEQCAAMTPVAGLRILIVTPSLPYPPISGFGMRVYQSIRHLSERHLVSLLTYASPDEPDIGSLQD